MPGKTLTAGGVSTVELHQQHGPGVLVAISGSMGQRTFETIRI